VYNIGDIQFKKGERAPEFSPSDS